MSDVDILILAAGASSRMRGADKLLEKVDTKPLLRLIAEMAVDTRCPVFITLPAGNQRRLACLSGLPVTQLEIEAPDAGMAVSLGAGLQIIPKTAKGVMVLLADMPNLTKSDLFNMLQTFKKGGMTQIVRATDSSGAAGHPVIFPADMFDQLAGLSGDKGAQSVLAGKDITWVTLPETHATTDLDTPEDWLAWRKQNPFRN